MAHIAPNLTAVRNLGHDKAAVQRELLHSHFSPCSLHWSDEEPLTPRIAVLGARWPAANLRGVGGKEARKVLTF